MTSSQGVELADQILEDPTKATALLRLLHAFKESRGDPLGEAFTDDVMLHAYGKIDHCRDSMNSFLSEQPKEKPNPVPQAA